MRIMDHAILRASVKFAHHRIGQHLLDAKRLALTSETWNRDGADILREFDRFARGVITTTGRGEAQDYGQRHASAPTRGYASLDSRGGCRYVCS